MPLIANQPAAEIIPTAGVADREGFERLRAEHMASLNMSPSYELLLSDGRQADLMMLLERGNPLGFVLGLSQESAKRFSHAPVNPDMHVTRRGDTVHFQYPGVRSRDAEAFLDRRSSLLTAKRIGPLVVPAAERQPRRIEPDDAAWEIGARAASGLSHILFCTGAGMSYLTGCGSITDNENFGKTLGFRDKDFDSSPKARKINDEFVHQLLVSPKLAEVVFNQYRSDMIEALEDYHTSPGHAAIADIIRAFEYQPGLITSNHDMQHEADGSRLQPLRSRRAWEVSNVPGIDETEAAVRKNMKRAIGLRARAATLIVATGMSSDSHGVLNYIRRQHYQGGNGTRRRPPIIAVNLSDELPYLGPDDFLVQGEANDILPDISNHLIPAWHPVRRARVRELYQDGP